MSHAIERIVVFFETLTPASAQRFAEYYTDDAYFKARLREQLCAISDGGCDYTGLDMVEAHSGMDLSEAQFNDFVDASRRAMTRAGFAIGVQNRLLARLAPMRGEVIHQ